MGRRFYLPSLHSQWMRPLHVSGSSPRGGRAAARRRPDPIRAQRCGRVALGSRERLPADVDGGVALCVQYLLPGLADAARWLPVPKDPLELVLRLCDPRAQAPSALPPGQGAWSPPAPRRVP
jgi:hypothetical protein